LSTKIAEPGSENKHQSILPTPKVLCKHNSFGVIALLGRRSRVRSWFLTFRMLTVVGCQAPNLFQIIGVGGGGLAQCPVGCGAFVVSCPRRVGSDTSSGCLAQYTEVRSHQDQRQEAKVKSEGKKTSSSSAGPGGRQETKREIQRCRDNPVLEIEGQ
jgi:hypothetical protein